MKKYIIGYALETSFKDGDIIMGGISISSVNVNSDKVKLEEGKKYKITIEKLK